MCESLHESEDGGAAVTRTTARRAMCLLARAVPVFLLLFLALGLQANAQTTSTIEGTVKDSSGAVVPGAEVKATGVSVAAEGKATSDATGFYRIAALPAGTYNLTVTKSGFNVQAFNNLEVTLNRVFTFDINLEVGKVQENVTINAAAPLLEKTTSETGGTINRQQIQELPVNGRNYLDLMELIPGVAVFRQNDPGPLAVAQGASDGATPVLGERGGNTNFLIDGVPNKDNVNGGPASQFNQETIQEFQVLTTGYKAEFGSASSAIVNVITKSGTNQYHGVASLFHRNSAFDASDVSGANVPFLLRWDYSLAVGGPIIKDKVFFFGSSERITESRRLNFVFPPGTPDVIKASEDHFDNPSRDYETRNFIKFDEKLGRHSITEEMNYSNAHLSDFLPLSQSINLPSTRNNLEGRHLLLGFSDTVLLGDLNNPWVLVARGSYRGEPSGVLPAHPDAGPATLFNLFDTYTSGLIFGNLGQIQFGTANTPSFLDQKYVPIDITVDKLFGRHEIKFGWNFLRTHVDGNESTTLFNQLFATLNDYATFGPVYSGMFTLFQEGGSTPQANEIHLRNTHNGVFAQDDWKLRHNLTVNAGLRWDYDSEFPSKTNFSPRIGAAWALNDKTVIRGQFGIYYDQFRLGLARDVPGFGGADLRSIQDLSFPRLFYGNPSAVPQLVGYCLDVTKTDAQIAASGETCHSPYLPPSSPVYGIDHLNGLVAPGHAPIPANTVVTLSNVQQLTGLTPDQFLAKVDTALGNPQGFFYFGPFGALTRPFVPAQPVPITVASGFKTPHTLSFTLGVQRQLTKDLALDVNYYHRDMRDILGVRQTNLDFISRIHGFERTYDPPVTTGPIDGYGPWFAGTFDGFSIAVTKRFSKRFTLSGFYSFSHSIDNNCCGITGLPSDSFVGIVPVVTDPATGKSNANGSFVASNGNFIAQAGTFSNGPNLDKGRSDLSVDHIFQVNGLVELPWGIQFSAIFSADSGFHFSRIAAASQDPDGNETFNGLDYTVARNSFTAPAFINMDMRVAKTFKIGERVKTQLLFEFFNLLNRANPAAVEQYAGLTIPFGSITQALPGREGQIGIRIQF